MTETVAQAIARYAPDQHVAEAMGLGALLEGGSLGSSGFGVGDYGQSHGPFQIYHVAHPDVTTAEAENPDYAVRYMLPSYIAAAKKVPASLWNTNPEAAAEHTAYLAERPAQDYYASRGSAVHTDWQTLQGKIPGLSKQPWQLPASGQDMLSGFSGGIGGMSGKVTAIVALVLLIIVIRK